VYVVCVLLRQHTLCAAEQPNALYIQWPNALYIKLQVIFRKRANNYRALLRKMTYEDKAS